MPRAKNYIAITLSWLTPVSMAFSNRALADAPTPVWTRTLGGSAGDDEGLSVVVDDSGNSCLAGKFKGTVDFDPTGSVDNHVSQGNWDIFVSVLNANGSYGWTQTIGGSYWDQASGIAIDSAGNILVTGRFVGTVDFDPTVGADYHTSSNTSSDIFVTKLASDGSYLWTYTVGGESTDEGIAVVGHSDGSVFVSGYFQFMVDFDPSASEDLHTSSGNEDVFLTKLAADGSYLWTCSFGGFLYDLPGGLTLSWSGNPVLVGEFRDTVDFDPGVGEGLHTSNGDADVFITEFDSAGMHLWTTTIGGPYSDEALGLAVDEEGILVTGDFRDVVDFDPGSDEDYHYAKGSMDMYLLKLHNDGSYAWARTVGGDYADAATIGHAVDVDDSGTVLVSGIFTRTADFDPGAGHDFRTSNGGADGYVAAFNVDGAYGAVYAFGGSSNDRALAVAISAGNQASTTGCFSGTADFDPDGSGDVHESRGGLDVFVTRLQYSDVGTPGACCVGPDCEFVVQSSCVALGGTFTGGWVTCEEADCDADYGACCVEAQCQLTTEPQCTALSGEFHGTGTACNIDLCGPEPAAGWWTLQHDAQRTGRSDAVVANEPVRVWSLLAGTMEIAPIIGPDGTIYVGNDTYLKAINADGSLKWVFGDDYADPWVSSPSIRADGNFWIGGRKRSHHDGSDICGGASTSAIPGTLDASGNSISSTGTSTGYNVRVRRVTVDCALDWSYVGGQAPASPVALGLDGGIHVSGEFFYAKLDPSDGSELWSVPTPARPGAPAIGPDGTIYRTMEPNFLIATYPDGTEKWSIIPSNADFRPSNDSPSPAIGLDGTVYFPGMLHQAGWSVMVAVSPAGVEQWMVEVRYGGGGFPAALDGNGTIITCGRDLVGLSSADGSELWRVTIGDPFGLAVTSPAIGEDGTVYVTTDEGYLLAFGDGPPEPPSEAPPFTYRKVVEDGDFVSGYTIEELLTFEIDANGLVTFEAQVDGSPVSAVFTELSGRTFNVIARGTVIDGYEIDMVSLPRKDDSGNVYMGAYVANVGPAIFVNNTLFVAASPNAPTAQVQLHSIERWSYVDHNESGTFLVLGKQYVTDAPTLLSINSGTAAVDPLVSVTDVIDGFIIDQLDPEPVDGYGDDGVAVVQAYNGQFAIITPTSVIVRTGDVIDDHGVSWVGSPRRTSSGAVYYIGSLHETNLFSYSSDGVSTFERGAGQTVAGHPIMQIETFGVNETGDLAYYAELLGSDGILLNIAPVAIAGVTEIDGVPVERLGVDMPKTVSVNDNRQVAFFAVREDEGAAIYVATPVPGFDADEDGDIDLDDSAEFIGCFAGPGIPPLGPDCSGWFDANYDGDVDCGDWEDFKTAWTGPPTFPPFFGDCDTDCNENSIADECDVAAGTSGDCNDNQMPDECEVPPIGPPENDCNGNSSPDDCETDLAPWITQQPVEQTVCDGEAATFTVTADGCPPLVYQWRKDAINIDGATQDLHSIDPVGVDDAGEYDVGVTNVCGSVTSQPTTLTVIPVPASPQPEAPVVAKNRYVSFVPANAGRQTALRITLADLPIPFSAFNGTKMWVGGPATYCENAGKVTPPCPEAQPSTEFVGADLQCTPHCMDWSTAEAVHVSDDEIIPGAVYDVQAIDCECDSENEANYSAPLTMTTATWGDAVRDCTTCPCGPPDGSVGIPTDVTAVLDKFKNLVPPSIPCAAIIKARADLDLNIPNQRVDISDVTLCLDAFRGFAYPAAQTPPATGWFGPTGCP